MSISSFSIKFLSNKELKDLMWSIQQQLGEATYTHAVYLLLFDELDARERGISAKLAKPKKGKSIEMILDQVRTFTHCHPIDG